METLNEFVNLILQLSPPMLLIVTNILLMMVWKKSPLSNRWIPLVAVIFGGASYPFIADAAFNRSHFPWFYNVLIGLALGAASTGLFEVARSFVKRRTGWDFSAVEGDTDFKTKADCDAASRASLKSRGDKPRTEAETLNVKNQKVTVKIPADTTQ